MRNYYDEYDTQCYQAYIVDEVIKKLIERIFHDMRFNCEKCGLIEESHSRGNAFTSSE